MSAKAAGLESHPTSPASWPGLLLLRTLALLVCVLPRDLLYALALPPALLLFAVTLLREPRQRRRGRGAQRNMRIAFPGLTPAQLRGLTWRYARHVAWLLLEALRQPLMTRARARARVEVPELERLRALAREGQGLIVATGHFGNWEMLQHVGPQVLESQVTSLARPCPEPGLQRWLVANRERNGQRVISKFGGLWPLKKALQRGEAIGLNMDENIREGGVFVPFCGVLAATNASAALLQGRSRAPIVVLTAQRVGPERFRLHVWRVVRHEPGEPAEDARRRVTAEVAAGFEEALRAYPEQWLWALRRWETRPPGELPAPDGLPPRAVAAAP